MQPFYKQSWSLLRNDCGCDRYCNHLWTCVSPSPLWWITEQLRKQTWKKKKSTHGTLSSWISALMWYAKALVVLRRKQCEQTLQCIEGLPQKGDQLSGALVAVGYSLSHLIRPVQTDLDKRSCWAGTKENPVIKTGAGSAGSYATGHQPTDESSWVTPSQCHHNRRGQHRYKGCQP